MWVPFFFMDYLIYIILLHIKRQILSDHYLFMILRLISEFVLCQPPPPLMKLPIISHLLV